jgi:futalosine hydrolase
LRKITFPGSLPDTFFAGNLRVNLLITGVGSVATSWALAKWISSNPLPDLAINAGIAGSYREEIVKGEVVIPVSDCFADAGIETGSGFMTLAEAGLEEADRFPFRNGRIIAENEFVTSAAGIMRPVRAITVNTASGTRETISQLRDKYDPDIETMEGAAFFYICSREKIPFIALRSVSNMVEPRNKEKWDIQAAVSALSDKLRNFLLMYD